MVRSLRLIIPAFAVVLAAGAALLTAPVSQAQADNTAPVVESVEFATDGPYKEDVPIEIVVKFSEPVYSTVSSDTVAIKILVTHLDNTMSEIDIQAASPDGEGEATDTIQFTYVALQRDRDGTVSVPAGILGDHAQYLRDAAGNFLGASPPYPAAIAKPGQDQRIDKTSPEIQFVDVNSEGPYGIGSTIEITATFTEEMAAAPGATLKIHIGGSERTATFDRADGQGIVFAYTVVSGDAGAVTVPDGSIAGTVTDRAGNPAASLAYTGAHAGNSPNVDPELVVTTPGSTGPTDITPPTVTYDSPNSLTVGIRIRTIAPETADTDIASFAVKEGSSLPATLRLDGTTGKITGRPTRGISHPTTVTVVVCDATGNCADATLSLPVIVDPDAIQTSTDPTLPEVEEIDLAAVTVGDAAPSTALRAAIALAGAALVLAGALAMRSCTRSGKM